MEPIARPIVNPIRGIVSEALKDRREDDIPEVQDREFPKSIVQLFDYNVVVKAQENPIKTTLIIGATIALSSVLLATATLIGTIAGATIFAVGLVLIGIKVLAVLKTNQKDKIKDELSQLELMGIITAKEAYAIKKTLNDLAKTRALVVDLQESNQAFQKYLLEEGRESFCARIGLDTKKVRIEDFELEDSTMTSSGMQKVEGKLLECIDLLQPSEHIEALKDAARSKDLHAFRSKLIEYYKAAATSHKEDSNYVAYYCYKEMARKIESVPPQEAYITFIRLSHQLAMLKKHDTYLTGIVNGFRDFASIEGHEDELSELVNEIKKLHQYTAGVLSDYHVVSTDVDDIFAYFRGNFAAKYRNIEAAISRLNSNAKVVFSELPFIPEVRVKIKDQKALNVDSKQHDKAAKVVKSEGKFNLDTELSRLKSVTRSIQEIDSVREITSGKELSQSLNPNQKSSIMLVTCSFGTGHKVAARALKDLIGPGAHVSIVDPTDYDSGILVQETDWIYKLGRLLGKRWSSTIAFNWILQEQHYWMVNLENKVDRIIRSALRMKGKNGVAPSARGIETKSKELLRHRILMERPNLITTTYHMDLNPFLEVAEELGLPLLHVPTDLDVKMEEVFGDAKPEYEHFRTVLPDSNNMTLETARRILADDQIHLLENNGEYSVAGIVLRPQFYIQRSQEDVEKLRRDRGIDSDTTVIALMSGGNGQDLPYPEMLLNSVDNGKKYHMIVVAGGNTAAGNALNAKRKEGQKFITGQNRNATIEVLEDPEVASDANPYYVGPGALSRLHAIADVGTTKPGGLSIAEFLQTGVPMMFDRRKDPMKWEDFNIDVLQRQDRGRTYTGRENFLELIDEVAKLGKKPKPNRAGLIIQQMAQMINLAEDSADAALVKKRQYLGKGIDL